MGALLLGAFFAVVGLTHFIFPGYYRTLVPAWFPKPGPAVAAAGVANILAGIAIIVPATRAAGAWFASVLIVVYLVSHFDAARTATRTGARWLDRPAGVVARVLVNLGYLAWAVLVAVRA